MLVRPKVILTGLVNSLATASALSVMGMAVLITVDTILRYAFHMPIRWSFETIQFLLVGCVFLALAMAEQENAHINVTLVIGHLPERARTLLRIFTQACVMFFLFFLIWKGAGVAAYSLEIGAKSHGIAALPLFPAYILMPIGSFLMFMVILFKVWQDIRTLVSRGKEPSGGK